MPESASRQIAEGVREDEFGAKDYTNDVVLRDDYTCRPLWVVSELYYVYYSVYQLNTIY